VQPPAEHIAYGIGADQDQREESMQTAAKHESATYGGETPHCTSRSRGESSRLRPRRRDCGAWHYCRLARNVFSIA
jgi:hypothetical protein